MYNSVAHCSVRLWLVRLSWDGACAVRAGCRAGRRCTEAVFLVPALLAAGGGDAVGGAAKPSIGRPRAERPDDLLPELLRAVQAAPRLLKNQVGGAEQTLGGEQGSVSAGPGL